MEFKMDIQKFELINYDLFIVSMQYRASTILTAQTGLWAPISLRACIYVLCLCWPVYVEVFWWVVSPSKNFIKCQKYS